MNVRPATADHVGVVAQLEVELFAADAWSQESVTEELTGPRRLAFVACDDDEVIGYAVGMKVDDVLDLHRVAVVPAARRAGTGRALLEAVLRTGRKAGARRMLLEVSAGNEAALQFYAGTGFVQVDRRPHYYRDGTDALVLARELEGSGS